MTVPCLQLPWRRDSLSVVLARHRYGDMFFRTIRVSAVYSFRRTFGMRWTSLIVQGWAAMGKQQLADVAVLSVD